MNESNQMAFINPRKEAGYALSGEDRSVSLVRSSKEVSVSEVVH